MTVQLSDDVWWINESYNHGNIYEHVSVYLIRHDNQFIVVDTGSFYHRETITESIEEVTDGVGTDAIILSHSDYPHSGNIGALQSKWNEVLLVASSGSPEVQGLPSSAVQCTIGQSLEVLGRKFSFIDPPLADRSHTTWIYDHSANVLFTADGFGSFHEEGKGDLTSGDMETGIPYDNIYKYHRDALVWLRYVDPEKLHKALEQIFDTYQINWIAPVHGSPVAQDDAEEYLNRLVRAVAQISDEYNIP